MRALGGLLAFLCSTLAAGATPPKLLWGKAYHVLPETHSDESGYFSLCEGKNGRIYIGTAKYGQNAFLVEFDPETEKQRVVIDTHKLCGLTATGYAAQAKIHTRNFVGPSGRIYVGSKQGYRRGPDDTADYPGGYVMAYDPAADQAECLGMPCRGQGVIDVAADEGRGLLYVVTCEDQHWMLGDLKGKSYRELGPLLAPYATTLLDAKGRANAITRDFQLAQHDPATDKVGVRDIVVSGQRLTADDLKLGPICWDLAADGRTAYLIRMSEPSLFAMDLASEGPTIVATNLGRMIEGKGFDSRGSLRVAPDGRVYAAIRVDNVTGFGAGYLHHVVRYSPRKAGDIVGGVSPRRDPRDVDVPPTRKPGEMEDLGVLAVKNPDFFDFGPGPDGKPKPWTHGFHRLPDGTLTPLHCHMALLVARDGTLYVTSIYPFTLLRIPRVP
ncbi:MAG TPA: hypothetical protein PLE19_18460 [Planctomycetota bacterium]|nr:hypothetical protein [Planctomycetota bacterium]HRR82028.1 hypothetical protein [Planctomycetota bacterium]HRT93562.1 hypothetical protein [Planctomycetota bacterium]